jgi:hypothetical protein
LDLVRGRVKTHLLFLKVNRHLAVVRLPTITAAEEIRVAEDMLSTLHYFYALPLSIAVMHTLDYLCNLPLRTTVTHKNLFLSALTHFRYSILVSRIASHIAELDFKTKFLTTLPLKL